MAHTIIDTKKSNGILVALINRNTKYNPYIVAWCYDPESRTWGQGHYFNNYNEAEKYYNERY